jgi:hypothetical protein
VYRFSPSSPYTLSADEDSDFFLPPKESFSTKKRPVFGLPKNTGEGIWSSMKEFWEGSVYL